MIIDSVHVYIYKKETPDLYRLPFNKYFSAPFRPLQGPLESTN